MAALNNKIDFMALVMVNNANPNGDPLNGNRPRQTMDGYGEISDVCIKRKIRNRLQDMNETVFVQSDSRCDDGYRSLAERAKNNDDITKAVKDKDANAYKTAATKSWIDVRAFGQVFAFKGESTSVGVRGPVTLHPAFSVLPVDIESTQITKSINGETSDKKASDTMGMIHRVSHGLYVIKGSISPQLAEDTGFTEEDAEKVKEAVRTLFVNDASAARPDGSMELVKLYWCKHNCKIGQYSTAKVHRMLSITANCDTPKVLEDYNISLEKLPELEVEEIEGL